MKMEVEAEALQLNNYNNNSNKISKIKSNKDQVKEKLVSSRDK